MGLMIKILRIGQDGGFFLFGQESGDEDGNEDDARDIDEESGQGEPGSQGGHLKEQHGDLRSGPGADEDHDVGELNALFHEDGSDGEGPVKWPRRGGSDEKGQQDADEA